MVERFLFCKGVKESIESATSNLGKCALLIEY